MTSTSPTSRRQRGGDAPRRRRGRGPWLLAAGLLGAATLLVWALASLLRPGPEPAPEPAETGDEAAPIDERGLQAQAHAKPGVAGPEVDHIRVPQRGLPRLPEEPAPADAPALTMERYFEARLDAECACAARQRGAEDSAPDLVACRALLQTIAPAADKETRDGVGAGRVAFDPVAAARCLQEYEACAQGDGETDRDVASACDAVFRGRVPVGGRCADDVDCVEGSCSKAPQEEHATCRLPSAKGGPCATFGDCLGSEDNPLHCIDGVCQPPPSDEGAHCELDCASPALWCDFRATPPVCRPRVPRDGVCLPGRDVCAASLACLDTAVGPRCRARADLDQPCDVSVHPLASCAEGLVCVAGSQGGRCRPRLELGADCEGDVQCPFPDAYCGRVASTGPGRCTTMPVDGQPCLDREVRGWRCRIPFVCNFARGLCVETLGEGAACDGHNCGGLNRLTSCVAGVCRARLAEGAACQPEPTGDEAREVARCSVGLGCRDGRCRRP